MPKPKPSIAQSRGRQVSVQERDLLKKEQLRIEKERQESKQKYYERMLSASGTSNQLTSGQSDEEGLLQASELKLTENTTTNIGIQTFSSVLTSIPTSGVNNTNIQLINTPNNGTHTTNTLPTGVNTDPFVKEFRQIVRSIDALNVNVKEYPSLAAKMITKLVQIGEKREAAAILSEKNLRPLYQILIDNKKEFEIHIPYLSTNFELFNADSDRILSHYKALVSRIRKEWLDVIKSNVKSIKCLNGSVIQNLNLPPLYANDAFELLREIRELSDRKRTNKRVNSGPKKSAKAQLDELMEVVNIGVIPDFNKLTRKGSGTLGQDIMGKLGIEIHNNDTSGFIVWKEMLDKCAVIHGNCENQAVKNYLTDRLVVMTKLEPTKQEFEENGPQILSQMMQVDRLVGFCLANLRKNNWDIDKMIIPADMFQFGKIPMSSNKPTPADSFLEFDVSAGLYSHPMCFTRGRFYDLIAGLTISLNTSSSILLKRVDHRIACAIIERRLYQKIQPKPAVLELQGYHWTMHRILTGAEYITQNTNDVKGRATDCAIKASI